MTQQAYPAIPKLWRAAWEAFTPFLVHDVEIRRVVLSTSAIESLNARYHRAVTARGYFPTEQAALRTLYLVTRGLDRKGHRAGTMGDAVEARAQRVAPSPLPLAGRLPAAENLYPHERQKHR